MSDNTNSRQLLTNVAIIRPILIVLLVFYHAFAIYGGAWESIDGYPVIPMYWWLDKLSYAFMLETFVFVSGYVFGYQVRKKGENKLLAKHLFMSKFKRLWMPSILFSLLYIICFRDITQPVVSTIRSLISGAGHMWFLPMLFWCFGGIWTIEKLKMKPIVLLPLLFLCAMVSFVPLPMHINSAMYFLLFFYFGYLIQRREFKLERFYKPIYVIALIVTFGILFPTLTLFRENLDSLTISWGGHFSERQIYILTQILLIFTKLLYSTVGLAMIFVIVGIVEKYSSFLLPDWIVKVGNLCMGVYLFQQFILMGLYKYTSLPEMVSCYWLPWLGFVMALILSLVLSYLIRLTKLGRDLI